MPRHALVTGSNISGRIPVPEHPDGWVDVTPDVLYFDHDSNDTPDIVHHVANAIEQEHYVRSTHPVQLACRALDDPAQYEPGTVDPTLIEAHRAEHAALNARLGGK